jgi:hypothetical protein
VPMLSAAERERIYQRALQQLQADRDARQI